MEAPNFITHSENKMQNVEMTNRQYLQIKSVIHEIANYLHLRKQRREAYKDKNQLKEILCLLGDGISLKMLYSPFWASHQKINTLNRARSYCLDSNLQVSTPWCILGQEEKHFL